MPKRHLDFERILNEFNIFYGKGTLPCPKGEHEYYQWLRALKLDETLCYSQTRESFTWAKDMITLLKEDTVNKYYKVLCAFPIKSMNGNVYREKDLIAAASTLKGCNPSVNHKDEYWLSPKNPVNKWGTATVEGARYEDGAVEVVLKVPRECSCPTKTKPLHRVIDDKEIVNVSLEGSWISHLGGFKFNEKGFTLLTSDILPGIPLARIFPIEAYMPFNSQSTNYKSRTVKVIGMTTQKKEEIDPITATDPAKKEPANPVPPVVDPVGTNVPVDGHAAIFPMHDNHAERTVLGEAQLKVDKLKAEQNLSTATKQFVEAEKAFELHRAELSLKLQESYTQNSKQQGTINAQLTVIEKLETQIVGLNKEKVVDATEVKSYLRRLEDMTESRDAYKKQYEELKVDHESVTAKYRKVLSDNLALEQRLTTTNEEYLNQAKKTEALEDKVKHVNRITRIKATF